MQQRMRAYPDKPAEKKDHKNGNAEPRVRRHPNGAATAAVMMVMAMVTSTPMRAAGRDPGIQVEDLWQTILVQEAEIRAKCKKPDGWRCGLQCHSERSVPRFWFCAKRRDTQSKNLSSI
jgi:hypothetical protein